MTLSLNSQWINNVGYSTSKETFANSEWRIYEGELQVHRNDSSFFYDLNKLNLNDKLKVVADTLKTIREYSVGEFFNILDSKFDKVNYKIMGNYIKIYDDKNLDSIFEINLGTTLLNLDFYESDIIFLKEGYYVFRSKNKIYIINNNKYLQSVVVRSVFNHVVSKLIVIIYNLDTKSYEINKLYKLGHLTNFKLNQFKLKEKESPAFYFSTEEGSYDFYSKYSIAKSEYYKFDTKVDSLSLILNSKYVGNILSINKNEEYNVEYNNYTFNSKEIKNWGNQVIDTNIRKYKARLIQEIIPNTYLMYSDSINYFIYNLIDNNLVVMDKLNDIHKKEQFSNEFIVADSKLFYAETASHQIARVSISSIIDNLISVDFSADKNMAD